VLRLAASWAGVKAVRATAAGGSCGFFGLLGKHTMTPVYQFLGGAPGASPHGGINEAQLTIRILRTLC
jgi:hypothetical protein